MAKAFLVVNTGKDDETATVFADCVLAKLRQKCTGTSFEHVASTEPTLRTIKEELVRCSLRSAAECKSQQTDFCVVVSVMGISLPEWVAQKKEPGRAILFTASSPSGVIDVSAIAYGNGEELPSIMYAYIGHHVATTKDELQKESLTAEEALFTAQALVALIDGFNEAVELVTRPSRPPTRKQRKKML